MFLKSVLLLLFLVSTGFTSLAKAQDTSKESPTYVKTDDESRRIEDLKYEPSRYKHILGDHVFLPSFIVPAPFTDSTVLLAMGFGEGTFRQAVPGGYEDLHLAALNPTLNVQVALCKSLALNLGIKANETTGLDGNSVLFYGASVSYDYSFGAIFELIRSDSTSLSLSLTVLRPHSFALSPFAAATAEVNAFVENSDPNLTLSNVSTQWKPAILVAHSFSSVFGLEGQLGLNINSFATGVDTTASTKLVGALGIDADLDPAISVPIGLSLGYQRNQVLALGALNSDTYAAGIFETFRKSFNAGIQIGRTKVTNISATTGALIVRIYFD